MVVVLDRDDAEPPRSLLPRTPRTRRLDARAPHTVTKRSSRRSGTRSRAQAAGGRDRRAQVADRRRQLGGRRRLDAARPRRAAARRFSEAARGRWSRSSGRGRPDLRLRSPDPVARGRRRRSRVGSRHRARDRADVVHSLLVDDDWDLVVDGVRGDALRGTHVLARPGRRASTSTATSTRTLRP